MTLIDAIIPVAGKDLSTLTLCLQRVRRHVRGLRHIHVISTEKYELLTKEGAQVRWVDERDFPFTLRDVAQYMTVCDRNGWYLQQLLKLYAPFVVPGIAEWVLSVDADTIFLNDCSFVDDQNRGLYATGSEHYVPYFEHMRKMWPQLSRQHPSLSGIAHHMIFSRPLLRHLINQVEGFNGGELFWKLFLRFVDPFNWEGSGASEYETYFNFLCKFHPDQMVIRPLRWKNVISLDDISSLSQSYDFVSNHEYFRRRPQPNEDKRGGEDKIFE